MGCIHRISRTRRVRSAPSSGWPGASQVSSQATGSEGAGGVAMCRAFGGGTSVRNEGLGESWPDLMRLYGNTRRGLSKAIRVGEGERGAASYDRSALVFFCALRVLL